MVTTRSASGASSLKRQTTTDGDAVAKQIQREEQNFKLAQASEDARGGSIDDVPNEIVPIVQTLRMLQKLLGRPELGPHLPTLQAHRKRFLEAIDTLLDTPFLITRLRSREPAEGLELVFQAFVARHFSDRHKERRHNASPLPANKPIRSWLHDVQAFPIASALYDNSIACPEAMPVVCRMNEFLRNEIGRIWIKMSTFVFVTTSPSGWDQEREWLEAFLATFPGEPAANTLVETVCFPNGLLHYLSPNWDFFNRLSSLPNLQSLTIGVSIATLWRARYNVDLSREQAATLADSPGAFYANYCRLDQLCKTTISKLVLRKGDQPPRYYMMEEYRQFQKEFPEHGDTALRELARTLAEGFRREGRSKSTTVLIDWASEWDSLQESNFEVIKAGTERDA